MVDVQVNGHLSIYFFPFAWRVIFETGPAQVLWMNGLGELESGYVGAPRAGMHVPRYVVFFI
jgi:hypothetical protein